MSPVNQPRHYFDHGFGRVAVITAGEMSRPVPINAEMTGDISDITCTECVRQLGFCAEPAFGGPCVVHNSVVHSAHQAGFNATRRAHGNSPTDMDACPNHPFRAVLYKCYDCGWKPPLKRRAKTKIAHIRDMILVPFEEGDDAMSIPDRLRTQDANAEVSWIFSRRGWVLAWGWTWFHWGLGFDVSLDRKDSPGIWVSLGPLEYGFYRDKDAS